MDTFELTYKSKRLCADCHLNCPVVNKHQCPLNILAERIESISIRDLRKAIRNQAIREARIRWGFCPECGFNLRSHD